MNIIFQICVGIMHVVSFITGHTYEEVNSIIFLYFQPILLLALSIIMLAMSLFWFKRLNIFIPFISALNFSINFMVTFYVVDRYSSYTLHQACLKAYKDLDVLGQITTIGYVNINILLFIILFLVLFFVSVLGIRYIFKNK